MDSSNQSPKVITDCAFENDIEAAVAEQLEPILDDPNLSAKQKVMCITKIVRTEEFSGPIPSPAVMAKYEALIPGATDRLLAMAEHQNEHRIKLEAAVIPEQQRQSRYGQLFAFVLCLLVIVIAGLLVWKEEYVYGMILLTVTVISIAALFIKGKSSIDKDIEAKQ